MYIVRMVVISKHSWTVLKVACAVVFATNIYLLLWLISKEKLVQLRDHPDVTSVVRPVVIHPFAHLLPSEDLKTRVKKCTKPKLSLLHDALSFAYHPMDPLNCSGSNLFLLQNEHLVPNITINDKQKPKMCEVFAIKRESDAHSFLKKLFETPGNTTVKITEDFVYVRCRFQAVIDTQTGTEQETGDNIKNDSATLKVNLGSTIPYVLNEPILLDKVDHIHDSFTERRNDLIFGERNLYLKHKQHSNETVDSVNYISRVQRDVKQLITVPQLNHNDSGKVKNYLINTAVVESHIDSEGPVTKENSVHIDSKPSVGILRYIEHNNNDSPNSDNLHIEQFNQDAPVKNKEHGSELQNTKQRKIGKYNISENLDEKVQQKNYNLSDDLSRNARNQQFVTSQIWEIDTHTEVKSRNNTKVKTPLHEQQGHSAEARSQLIQPRNEEEGRSTVEPSEQSHAEIENAERTMLAAEEDEYGESDPVDSEQQDLDENYARNRGEFYDDWDGMDVDEMYAEVPGCDEEQFLVQVSQQKHVFDRYRIRKSSRTSGMNVLMLGIDSMSSLAFQRKLPLTLNFLKKELDATIFESYNIVGDGTTQALLPMFLGKLQQEIPDILHRPLDDLDFVWKHYQMQGYVTMFAEDQPHLGVFNLRLQGFEEMPTDHYMRYFWQSQGESHLKRSCSALYCTGPTPNHQYLLQYLKDFFHKYHGIPHFAVGFSGELSHDEINPSEYLDKDLTHFLAHLKAEGYLNNTVVVLFADHGSRKGILRQTLQGKIEERLPFLSIVLPTSFRNAHKKLYENLRKNSNRLTSPFDIHETLLHLLDLSKAKLSDSRKTKRGVSLLRSVPENRTCSQAGIDTHWCTCVQEKPVPTSDPVVKLAAQAVISEVNNLTQTERHQCALLKLKVIHSASIVIPNLEVLKFHRTEETSNFDVSYGNATMDMAEFQITLETNKCGGIFEATVQVHYHQDNILSSDGDMSGIKLTYNVFEHDISRINTYGSQPACVSKTSPHLMKFCCCNTFLRGEKLKT